MGARCTADQSQLTPQSTAPVRGASTGPQLALDSISISPTSFKISIAVDFGADGIGVYFYASKMRHYR